MNTNIVKTSILTTLSSEMLGFDALKSMKFGHFLQKNKVRRKNEDDVKTEFRRANMRSKTVPEAHFEAQKAHG